MTSESQRKAAKKYKEKYNKETLKRFTVDFYPAQSELWEHLRRQPNKQAYIKDLIRADMNKGEA